MTLALAFSLLLQVTAVIIVLRGVRGQVFRHPGALLIIVAVIYDGVDEFANRLIRPGPERYGLTIAEVDRWMWFVGPGILLLAVSYLATLRPSTLAHHRSSPSAMGAIIRTLDWRVLAALTAPLYLYSVFGALHTLRGASSATYLQSGLTAQFMLPCLVLLSFSLVMRFGTRLILPVLLAQSLLLLLLGERIPIVAALVMLLFALQISGIRLSGRQVRLLVAGAMIAMLAITLSRSVAGRTNFATNAGPTQRLHALEVGLLHPGYMFKSVRSQYVYRLDGNDFASFTLAGISKGIPPVGITPLINNITLAIPSFLDPAKDSSPLATRSTEALYEPRYEMPPMNRLPTLLGTLLGYFGPFWFEFLCILLGVFFGLADRWVQRPTAARIVLGIGLVLCVMLYEQSPAVYPLTFRGVLVILALVKAAELARQIAAQHMGERFAGLGRDRLPRPIGGVRDRSARIYPEDPGPLQTHFWSR